MNKNETQSSTIQKHSRKKGMCQNTATKESFRQNPKDQNRGRGICTGMGSKKRPSEVLPSEPVVNLQTAYQNSSLAMLKDQAQRMSKALQAIEAQILEFSGNSCKS